MLTFTRNPWDDLSSMSKIYDSSPCSSTIQQLSKHCYKSSSATKRLFNIKSCEIDNKLKSSPTQNMIDALYESGISFPELVNVSNKMSILKDQYHPTFNKFHNYHASFQKAAFRPFSTYFASRDVEKFAGNASDSIINVSKIHNHLLKKSAQMKPNTLIQVEARIPLTPSTENNISDADKKVVDDDEDDDGDNQYNQQIRDWHSMKENNHQQKPCGLIHDVNLIEAKMKRFNLLDSENSIDRVMQKGLPPLNNQPFKYQHIEMKVKGDEVKICETNNIVPNCAIEYKQSLNMILNSINSVHNAVNTLTFLFIVYHDLIMLYAYITNSCNKSFGSRIFQQDLVTKIPLLFTDTNISFAAQNEINHHLTFKKDTGFEECKWILFTAFDLQNAVNRWNKNRTMNNMDFAQVQNIFIRNNITKEFFAEKNNRPKFIKLLQKHDLILAAANHLWYNLGGVPFDADIHVKEDENTDLDLDIFPNEMKEILNVKTNELYGTYSWVTNNNNDDSELKADVIDDIDNDAIQINDKVDIEPHRELTHDHVSPSPVLQNNDNTQFEYPPWSEYENDRKDYDDKSNFSENCDLLIHQDSGAQVVELDDNTHDIDDSVHEDADTDIELSHRYQLISSISANVYNIDNPRAPLNVSPDSMPNSMRYYDQLSMDRPPWQHANASRISNESLVNTGPAAPNLLPTMPPYIPHGQTSTILPSLPPSYSATSVPTYPVHAVFVEPTTSSPPEYSSTTPTF